MLGIFLDSETNGLNINKHRILEIAIKLVDLKTGELKDQYQSIVFQPQAVWEKSDLDSLQVNGFTPETVQDGLLEKVVADEIKHLFKRHNIERGEAVFICQNPSFDRAFFSQLIDADEQEKLNWPYHWLDLASMYWASAIKDSKASMPWDTGVSKNKIAKVYQLDEEKTPHRAMNGVDHLILCYEAVVGFPDHLDK